MSAVLSEMSRRIYQLSVQELAVFLLAVLWVILRVVALVKKRNLNGVLSVSILGKELVLIKDEERVTDIPVTEDSITQKRDSRI